MLHDVNETAELDFVVVIDTAESSLAVLQKPRVFFMTLGVRDIFYHDLL